MSDFSDFEAIINAAAIETPKHVFEYETVTVDGAA